MNETNKKTPDIEVLNNQQLVLEAVQKWKQVLDESPDMVAILDKRMQVIMLNRTASLRLGVSEEVAAGKDYCKLLHNGSGMHSGCPHSRLDLSGEPQICKEPINILGRSFKVSVSPLRNIAGEIIATVHVAQELC